MLFLADSQHANFNQHRQISAGQMRKARNLALPTVLHCVIFQLETDKNRKAKEMKEQRKVFVTSYRFSYCGEGISLGKSRAEGVLTLTIVLFTWPPTFRSQCVCVCACLFISHDWILANSNFSINFNARQPADLKKYDELTRCGIWLCLHLFALFGLVNELDFYRFRLAFRLCHFLFLVLCLCLCILISNVFHSAWLDLFKWFSLFIPLTGGNYFKSLWVALKSQYVLIWLGPGILEDCFENCYLFYL